MVISIIYCQLSVNVNEIGHDMQKLSMKNPVVEFYFGNSGLG